MTPRTEDLAAKFSRVRHAVDQIRARVDVGGVSVEADGDGKLATVTFSAEALALGPEVLADVVIRAYRQSRVLARTIFSLSSMTIPWLPDSRR
jgi:DNA-binding protein YbaB